MSNLSAIEYVTSPSALTTGLLNQRYSVISANFAALNSDVTRVVGSGTTLSILTNLETSGGAHFQFISVGSTPPSYVTTAAITVEVNSAYSDYMYFIDSSGQKSSYVVGSRAGNLADGLNIWDASAGTMIASFSKQSIRFFQQVVGPVFDVGGALSDTYNAATFGTGALSTESRIQAAINQASIDGVSRVYVPASMYPYSASSISFVYTVQMVREGGNWSVYDVRAYGAPSGATISAASSIRAADANARGVYYSQGSYLYDSRLNPSFVGGVQLEVGAGINGSKYTDIIKFDPDGNLIGLQHNHLEEKRNTFGTNSVISSGTILSPPLSRANVRGPIDVMAHWYNDFGLERTRVSDGGSQGSSVWYYWNWNFSSNTNAGASQTTYDPKRHPLLGWYRGDDPNVLDWQCYWMREYGVTGVILTSSALLDTTQWSRSSDTYYWVNQLFTKAPNFTGLRYALWGPDSGTSSAITVQWESLVSNVYLQYNNFYAVEHNGSLYPAMYVFEGSNLFTNVGGTQATFMSFATRVAQQFQTAGYGGVAMLTRHPKTDVSLNRQLMEQNGVLYFACDYTGDGTWVDLTGAAALPIIADATTYAAQSSSWSAYHGSPQWLVGASYSPNAVIQHRGWLFISRTTHVSTANDTPDEGKNQATNWFRMGQVAREVTAIPTSLYAVSPHPSAGLTYFRGQGSTATLFRDWFQRGINLALAHDAAKIITIYNVSEWGEGGAGLQPNRADGFGYLEAVRAAVEGSAREQDILMPVPKDDDIFPRFVAAASIIPSERAEVRLTTDASRVMTGTPSVATGQDGQRIRLLNTNTSNFTITLQDDATLAGSTLFLASSLVTLGLYESVELSYVSGKGWVQEPRAQLATMTAISFGAGTALAPTIAFTSEASLGFYRSAGSTIAQSYGTFAVPSGGGFVNLGGVSTGYFGDASNLAARIPSATGDFYIQTAGGGATYMRSGPGITGTQILTGYLGIPAGSATTPGFTYTSDLSVGFYRSGVSTIAQSAGTFNLATNAVRFSMRTLAASSVTASAAKTNMAVNEVVFTIGGASGASLIIYSGGTAYGFNSAFSAAAS